MAQVTQPAVALCECLSVLQRVQEGKHELDPEAVRA